MSLTFTPGMTPPLDSKLMRIFMFSKSSMDCRTAGMKWSRPSQVFKVAWRWRRWGVKYNSSSTTVFTCDQAESDAWSGSKSSREGGTGESSSNWVTSVLLPSVSLMCLNIVTLWPGKTFSTALFTQYQTRQLPGTEEARIRSRHSPDGILAVSLSFSLKAAHVYPLLFTARSGNRFW